MRVDLDEEATILEAVAPLHREKVHSAFRELRLLRQIYEAHNPFVAETDIRANMEWRICRHCGGKSTVPAEEAKHSDNCPVKALEAMG